MHEKHRERVKQRFLSDGLDSFNEHQVLELVLFYALPRVDTNEIAHELINEFGSLKRVADASIEELTAINHIGDHAAIMLKLIAGVSKRYFMDPLSNVKIYDTLDKIGEYLINLYIDSTSEKIYLLLFDGKMRMIKSIMVAEGSLASVQFPMREIIKEIINLRATSAVIAHNHPDGALIPSREDVDVTMTLMNAFEMIDCQLVEHIIVADRGYLPVMESVSKLKMMKEKIRIKGASDAQ